MAIVPKQNSPDARPSGLKQSVLNQWGWISGYSTTLFADDFLAAVIVTILLVPQSLAYALLAGLPPQVGIYVSILPLIAYALFGSSNYLNVGPTAVISLMTAAIIATLPPETRLLNAAALAFMTGVVLILAGLFRAGFVMNFVSRPVVSAYITGAALLIVFSQLKHVFGVDSGGGTVWELWVELSSKLVFTNIVALYVGLSAIVVLWGVKQYLAFGLVKLRIRSYHAKLIARMAPIIVIAIYILISQILDLPDRYGVRVVGEIPAGMPPFVFPSMDIPEYENLIVPAIVIAIVAFVDSTSTAQELASRSRQRIDSNKELLGLGASNIVAGLSGGYPINGSMSRSAVNFTAGGKTPVVSILVAAMMAITAVFFTPVLKNLPLAVLAALIIVACFSLFDFKSLWRTWIYNRADGVTALATLLSVLFFGVQWGVLVGVVLAMALHIRATLRPHIALVGRFPGTQHYRDASRFNVETHEKVKTLRIDESLYYANARYLEDRVAQIVSESPEMTDLILMCTAVSHIDASALSSLEEINKRLRSAAIDMHFSDIQSRVKERLFRSNLIQNLSGQIFLSQHEAMEALEPDPDWSQLSDHMDIH